MVRADSRINKLYKSIDLKLHKNREWSPARRSCLFNKGQNLGNSYSRRRRTDYIIYT